MQKELFLPCHVFRCPRAQLGRQSPSRFKRTVIDTPLQRIIAQSSPELAPRTLAIGLPYSSLERDFCRRRLARQKGPEDDVSAQRPAIGGHHMREMAAKRAFLLASYQLRVSEDWVVGQPGLEPGTH